MKEDYGNQENAAEQRAVAAIMPDGFEMVIEDAKRMVEFYQEGRKIVLKAPARRSSATG